MCEWCDQIDQTVAHYRWLKNRISDTQVHEAADRLIEELQAKKAALTPQSPDRERSSAVANPWARKQQQCH